MVTSFLYEISDIETNVADADSELREHIIKAILSLNLLGNF